MNRMELAVHISDERGTVPFIARYRKDESSKSVPRVGTIVPIRNTYNRPSPASEGVPPYPQVV